MSPVTIFLIFLSILKYPNVTCPFYEVAMSPVIIFVLFLSILNTPMSPVEYKKRQCRPVEFKGQGPPPPCTPYPNSPLVRVWTPKIDRTTRPLYGICGSRNLCLSVHCATVFTANSDWQWWSRFSIGVYGSKMVFSLSFFRCWYKL